ncbi:Putative Rieske [Penicillium brasilianum]|uniref:Putative Rieske n=1 Tax=Penicillium brasilianum TaxID=104259 RepID=A0A0F7TXC8_PENBI|nr:Putative Rieske [Penicillium brasilianum]
MLINCGLLSDFTQTRYVIHLSTGKRLVLFRLPSIDPSGSKPNETQGWSYYAMEAECPHAGGPMADSQVDIEDSAYIVSCPWHAYDFNVETGESSVGIKACTFLVDVRDGSVTIDFPIEEGTSVGLGKIEPVSEKVKLKHAPPSNKPAPKQEDPGMARYLGDEATLCDWAVHILSTANPEHKIELTTHLYHIFTSREGTSSPMEIGRGTVTAPDQPPRENMVEVKPGAMPKTGKGGSLKSRIAMLHALANIELWAIDLAIDICVRFSTFKTVQDTPQELPRAYFHDWLKVARDEAKHFSLLRTRLEEMGSHFGALPVHHGLWQSATETAHDLRSRISIIALVHEARGLDVNPMTIQKFRNAQDNGSVEALEVIHNDEITHVTTGHRWLTWICAQEGTDPVQVFRNNVSKHFRGSIQGPFNDEARLQAGMDRRYYGTSPTPVAAS